MGKKTMRSVKETIEYLNDRIKQTGMTKAEVLTKAGLSRTIFTMALNRNAYLRVESMISLGEVLNVTVGDILGLDDGEYPEDIQKMLDMLKDISLENRKMISMNIENYFKVELWDKANMNREKS